MWNACVNCKAQIGVALEDVAKILGPKGKLEVWDAIGEVFDSKYDLYYRLRKKEEAK